MPRQQLNTPARRVVTRIGEGEGSFAVLDRVQIGWAQDGDKLLDDQHWENTPYLHLGWTGASAGESLDLAPIVYMSVDCDEVIRAADEIKRMRDKLGGGSPVEWDFHTNPLGRDELQAIVKTARRARDAFYGGDE